MKWFSWMILGFFSVIAMAETALLDPTQPPGWVGDVHDLPIPKDLKLNEIITNPPRAIAIINGQRLGVGSTIGGYFITGINADVVYLRNANGIFKLPLTSSIKSFSQSDLSNVKLNKRIVVQ